MDDFLSHSDAALLNRNKVLHYVRNQGRVSRTGIWSNMSISRASVTQVIRQLQETGLIMETGEKQSSGRRMSRYLCVNNDSKYSYVFDWNSHLMCLVNLGGEVLERVALSFPQNCTPSGFASILLDGIETLKTRHPVKAEQLLGLGVTLPGLIDSRCRTVLYSVELGWRDVDIGYLFAEAFGENIYLERTGNMIALGEYAFGLGKGSNHMMLILLENEGVGLSAVIHGDCQHGNNYMFGELGHIKLDSDVMCSCGQRGCLEAVVRNRMMENGGVVDAQVMEYVAFGVSTAVNLSDPGVVLLSGKLVRGLTPAQQDQLIACIRRKITNERSRALEIHVCPEDNLMGARGMSAYMFNCCFPI